jgi:putative ABC transport system permease protein
VNEIFGASMRDIMVVLLALLACCLLLVAWVAWRRPVIFKLGVRNIPRRRTQTTLIVIGLMLSTLIISAALGTGDTIDYSATLATYESLGHVDELVVHSTDFDANVNNALTAKIDQDMFDRIEQTVGADTAVDGLMPVLIETVPAVLQRTGQASPQTFLIGVDPARLPEFGGLRSADSGKPIDLAGTGDRDVVLSEKLAKELDAVAGDEVTIFYQNVPVPLKVAAIAEDSPLSGRFDTTTPGMVVTLARLQAATRQPGKITLVGVSNQGGVRDGLRLTHQVVERLRPALAGQPLGVDPIKQSSIDDATQFATIFTSLFLVLGLFSIAVGILLIVLIFTMLAAERRPEMGMERAIGAHRFQLVQQFVAEGAGYALLAGLVGAACGVLATIGIALAFRALFGDFFPIRAHVTARSLIVAYCLGVVITFLAVAGSSWKISRLNIVAAVRDIPDVSSPTRKKTALVWAALLMFGGTLLAILGQGATNAFSFYGGMSLVPFGVGMLLRFVGVPARPIFSLVGIYLVLLWLLPADASERLFGDLGGGFEMFFLSGIFMVAGATILIVNNLDLLLGALGRLGGVFRSRLPAIRTAIAYPGATRGRTGLTVAMFSLIVFSLVMFATINQNFVNLFLGDDANAGWDVRASALSANPIGDAAAFDTRLRDAGVDTSGFEATGMVTTGSFQAAIRLAGTEPWKTYAVQGMDDAFLDQSRLFFQQRANGFADDAAVLDALRTGSDVAVIDQGAIPSDGPFDGDPDFFSITGLTSGDTTFDPVQIELQRPDGGAPVPMTIIGIIDSKIGSLFGLFASQRATAPVYPTPDLTSYFVRLTEPDHADATAKAIEKALLNNGVQATSIRDELKEFQRQNASFLSIIQGFMGLGLLVGIAAVGVIAFRNVVERRQQIGMLRALGYQKGMVALSFLIESLFVVGLGVVSGTILGLILARNLFADDDFAAGSTEFVIPWTTVVAILVVTLVAALLMTWLPARQASRLAPAEALRYE